MTDKPTRLTIRLGEDARTYLQAEAAKRGLDEAAFARMLIYERMNGADLIAGPAWSASSNCTPLRRGGGGAPAASPVSVQSEFADGDGALDARATDADLAAAGEPRAEEFDIAADADGGNPEAIAAVDALLAAGPSFLDSLIAERRSTAPAPQPRVPMRMPQRQIAPAPRNYRAQRQGLQPSYGPGSLTRPLGVNEYSIGEIQFGDGSRNVGRQNMGHFGVGPRRR
ncbi:MAG TPA: hypothetical protein VHY10_16255 [Xanthobacteraceae bacterium]|jgi:hypothetical protein|nr:hypothetical protein [Xanthobacteraceae bacterium]